MKWLSGLFSTLLGVGFIPIAPGTIASFLTAAAYKFYLFRLTWPWYILLMVAVFITGALASSKYAKTINKKDPGTVVIDEVLGQLIPLLLLPPEWVLIIAAFILFRFFDILKPLFIKKIESFPWGWGIMLDDVLAGIYTGIIINIYLLIR
jgi:phosphatidylglycerophosphatase A